MRAFLNVIFRNRTLGALWLFVIASPSVWAAIVLARSNTPTDFAKPLILCVVAAVLALPALGLLLRWRWARWVGAILLLLFGLGNVLSLVAKGWLLKKLLIGIGQLFVGYGLWKEPDDSFLEDSDVAEKNNPRETVSLVHLRSRSRYLESMILAQCLSDAWKLRITAGEEDEGSQGFVVSDETNQIFMVMVREPHAMMFAVHNFDRPYFNDNEEAANGVPNMRFAEIIRTHQAWLSIDLVGGGNDTGDLKDAYRLIGKALAALADEDTLAILCPQHSYFNLWSESLEQVLCGDDPLAIFRQEVKAPVVAVPNSDDIEQSIAEAQLRWPEFVQAFHQRDKAAGEDAPPFIVKARFVNDDDHAEHMWIHVFGLEPEYVHGHLLSEPLDQPKLKKGQQVEVAVTDVSDWVFAKDGQPVGNFTGAAIKKAADRSLAGN